MSLVNITADLDAQWQRTTRRSQPTIGWAATDPAIPADPTELRARLADHFGPAGRDLLCRIVTLAAAGDRDAALAATLTVLSRLVRWEPAVHQRRNSTLDVEHDALAAAVWEAIVTEKRPNRPFLRERIEQIAWGAVKKPVIRSSREPATDRAANEDRVERPTGRVHTASFTAGPVETEALSAAAITALLDELAAAGRLTTHARQIIENLAAGGDGLRHDPKRGPRAAATERRRLVTRLRNDPSVLTALAG